MSFLVAFQTEITTTDTSQNLPSYPIIGSVTVEAPSTNTGNVFIGNSPDVTATTGYILEKGLSVKLDLPNGNTDSMWVYGTGSDVISVIGG